VRLNKLIQTDANGKALTWIEIQALKSPSSIFPSITSMIAPRKLAERVPGRHGSKVKAASQNKKWGRVLSPAPSPKAVPGSSSRVSSIQIKLRQRSVADLQQPASCVGDRVDPATYNQRVIDAQSEE
jgi:hypothetical protein